MQDKAAYVSKAEKLKAEYTKKMDELEAEYTKKMDAYNNKQVQYGSTPLTLPDSACKFFCV